MYAAADEQDHSGRGGKKGSIWGAARAPAGLKPGGSADRWAGHGKRDRRGRAGGGPVESGESLF